MSANNLQNMAYRIGILSNRQTGLNRQTFLSFRKASVLGRYLHDSERNSNVTPSLNQAEANQKAEDVEELSENDRVNPEFVNRNPRNLERMAVARKDKGWSQSHPRRDYWHKAEDIITGSVKFVLFVSKSNRHITAHVEHINGHVVVRASTKEWAIKQHLYSTSDVSASLNLGRVLAQRCLESGVSYVHLNMFKTTKEQEGMKAFLEAFQEGGVIFGEPKSIVDFNRKHNYFPDVD